jgi:hypothetical protein
MNKLWMKVLHGLSTAGTKANRSLMQWRCVYFSY